MPPKFGTSGLRGLVTELTTDCVARHVQAFLASCPAGAGVYIGHDLRDSSPRLAQEVADAARKCGAAVTHCGAVPTPALALAAGSAEAAAVMITGSHIPADRNGLKFYTPSGEITKDDEQGILSRLDQPLRDDAGPAPSQNDTAHAAYLDRYATAFANALSGMTIGVYAHSAVGRDHIGTLLQDLGATVVELGRADHFVPVDTEAVSPETRAQLRDWALTQPLDAIVSTDADGDRPLLADELGQVVPGDVLGQITAQGLGATHVVTPVSSNTSVEASGAFQQVVRTKIGSPFVIAAMEAAQGLVAGYEANGGFLLGFDAAGPTGPLPALMTRDALLPLLATLHAGRETGIASLVAGRQTRFTAADRIQDVPTEQTQALIQKMTESTVERDAFLAPLKAQCVAVELTDGLRMTLSDTRILHLRPSGNAPELRIYIEADQPSKADKLLKSAMKAVLGAIYSKKNADM